MIDPLAGALVGHAVGDFLLQNDWMALNKKQRSLPCAVHCLLYTAAVMAFSGWWSNESAALIAAAVFVPHFVIDRTQLVRGYMWLNGQSKFAQPPMSPWSMIAVDNAMHFACLWVVAVLLA